MDMQNKSMFQGLMIVVLFLARSSARYSKLNTKK